MALENGLWRLIFKLEEDAEDEEELMFKWVQMTYQGTLEVHSRNFIHPVKVITFNPVERRAATVGDHMGLSDLNPEIQRKRSELIVAADQSSIIAFEHMRASGATFPWITATLRTNVPRRRIAWMLGVKNAIVIGKGDDFRGIWFYRILCDEVSEMMPKDLAPVPPQWRAGQFSVEPLF